MNNNIVLAPVIIPMLTAILLMFCRKSRRAQRLISGISAVGMLGVAVYIFTLVHRGRILVFCASGWQPPFGITMVMDLFSCIMVLLSAVVSLACLWFGFRTIDKEREDNFFYPLWFLQIMGINGSFITGDLFNLFVFFEIMLMSSYVLVVLGNTRGQLRESLKYLILNMIASTLFLIALAVLYGMVGTLNMADISRKLSLVANQNLVTLIGMLFFVVFGFKAAVFPVYFWLPKSYVQPPAPVRALFGGLLTKVGVYALLRVFTLIFIHNTAYTHTIFLVVGCFTMFLGVMGAVAQMEFKQILSIHVISQIGYMVMGLGIFTVWSIAGVIFFLAHNIIVKTCLFLLEGATEQVAGTGELKKLGGLLGRYPTLGWSFLAAGLALAGLPPLSGFFAKLVLMESAVRVGNYWVLAVAVIVSFFTLFSMMKIFIYAFWGDPKVCPEPKISYNYKKLLPSCFFLMVLFVALGVFAQPVMEVTTTAAQQMMSPQVYINTVLSTAGIR